MAQRKDDGPEKRGARLHGIPPAPPMRHGDGREVTGIDVLRDVHGDLGLMLWLALRRVEARVTGDPAAYDPNVTRPERPERERLLAASAEAIELVGALGTFALLYQLPTLVETRELMRACLQVHDWASERHLLHTAALFAEAAAYVDQDDPVAANAAARACRRAALNERSSIWYSRAFRLAVRKRSRRESIRALLGFGNLMYQMGRHEEARPVLETAARRAEHFGRRRQAAEAQHDLLAIASEAGTYASAERHVREALRLYPSSHPRLPYLVHDFGYLLSQYRLFSAALPLFQAVLPLISAPADRVLVWASIARASAGAGQRARAAEATEHSLRLVALYEEHAAACFAHLCRGGALPRTMGARRASRPHRTRSCGGDGDERACTPHDSAHGSAHRPAKGARRGRASSPQPHRGPLPPRVGAFALVATPVPGPVDRLTFVSCLTRTHHHHRARSWWCYRRWWCD